MFKMPLIEVPYRCEPHKDLEEVRKKMPNPPNNWSCLLYGTGTKDETWVAHSKDGKWEQRLISHNTIEPTVTLQEINMRLIKIEKVLGELVNGNV